jgi:hypothetical protein
MREDKKKEQPSRPPEPDRKRDIERERERKPLREERDADIGTRIEPNRPWERG